jgi:hypothetical protein
METAGKGGWWQYITKMPKRTYVLRRQSRTVPNSGELEIIFRFKAKYQIPSNFFIDMIQLEAELDDTAPPDPDPPPTDEIEKLWKAIGYLEKEQSVQNDLLVTHGLRLDDLERRVGALEPTDPKPPPVGNIDLSRYLPQLPVGYWIVMQKSEGGTIDHQLQTKNGITYLVKSAAGGKTNYEELRVTASAIERRYDTSPADGKPYKLDDQTGSGWSVWCNRFVNVGDVIERRPYLSRYEPTGDCRRISGPSMTVSYLKVFKRHPSWRGAADGKLYSDVLELHWQFSPTGNPVEKYFIAPGRWYVGWQSVGDGKFHYAVDEPQGREPLSLKIIDCLK